MRAAGTAFPAARAATSPSPSTAGRAARSSVDAPFWGARGPASIESQVSGTPYAGMYALARRLASGAATPYDAAQRIELYLRASYAYRQNVPNHAYPLPDFLAQDRAGYCQQFSGSMALMLRMLGIPARVSTGFAPGGRDPERNNFLVDDTDAHDWVEVFFPAIGWVTFDPTPGAAPAATQLDDNNLGITKPRAEREHELAPDQRPAAHGPARAPSGPVRRASPRRRLRAPPRRHCSSRAPPSPPSRR